MKAPLNVYVVYHKRNKAGSLFYDELFNLLCRDTHDLSKTGMGIPVYKREISDAYSNLRIDKSSADRNVYFVLIDVELYIAGEVCKNYITELYQHVVADSRDTLLIPIAMYKYAGSYSVPLGDIQYINVGEHFSKDVFQSIELEIFDTLSRFLVGHKDKKIHVFLSHSKRDADKMGVRMAESAKAFIQKELRLNTFFDVNDIVPGYNFKEQIEKHAKDGVMLVIFSNTYSSREWCRREITCAKSAGVPIVLLLATNGQVERVFPYIGNHPAMVFKGDWNVVIKELLHSKLAMEYARQTTQAVCGEAYMTNIAYMPEAFHLTSIGSDKQVLIYPDPPMPKEEEELLTTIKPNIQFYTPIRYATKDYDFKGKKIAISVSEGEDLADVGVGADMIREVVLNVSKYLLLSKAKLVYGGNLQGDGYTDFFGELTSQYCKQETKEEDKEPYFFNYIAWPICRKLTSEDKGEYINNRVALIESEPDNAVPESIRSEFVAPINIDNLYYWSRSLTAMRRQMLCDTSARIFISGKCTNFKGQFAGLLEEFLLSLESGQPVYLLGGFGGMSKMIGDLIDDSSVLDRIVDLARENPIYDRLMDKHAAEGEVVNYDRLMGLSWERMNNGLSIEECKELFATTNINVIVQLISSGLSKVLGK